MNEEKIVQIVHRCIEESPRINRIEADVSTLKSDVSTLKSDVSELKEGQIRQGVLFEEMQTKMDKLMDVVLDSNRRLQVLEGLEDFKQQTTDRLDAVEDTVRRHIKNRRAHRTIED